MAAHNKFSAEQETWLRTQFYLVRSYAELTDKFNATFGTNRNSGMISDKCSKRLGLKGMHNSAQYGNKPKEQLPLGTIRKSQTATYVKVAYTSNEERITGYPEPYWLPLQKKIYQDAHGEIAPGQMVCFLDNNPENFELDNLYAIDRRIAAILAMNKWWTESKEHTLTAIKWCELHYKLKETHERKTD